MTRAVRDAINTLAEDIAKDADIDPSLIFEVVFVCNPVMHHLLLGIDPVELGQAPFALATSESVTLQAYDLDLTNIAKSAQIYSFLVSQGTLARMRPPWHCPKNPENPMIWY